MNELARLLRAEIERRGPITVAAYMAAALGHPEFGYYMRKDPLGARGDFITAPEISQMFGELTGIWSVICWRRMGRPDPVRLVELGPGRGTLMSDALRAAKVAPDLLAAADLHLVESSPGLVAAQQKALAGHKVTWHAHLDRVPDGPLVLIANEFFDALPVHQFERTEAGWVERLVGIDPETGGLRFTRASRAAGTRAPIADELRKAPLQAVPLGSVSEVAPQGLALARAIGSRLKRFAGVALIVDYGPARSAPGETLQAVKGHKSHDVLTDPGEADLTAHVDFEALGRAAAEAGASVHGPVPQGAFLLALGITERAEKLLQNASPAQARDIRSACERLVAPSAMGGLFKALALAHPGQPPPPGFETSA